LCAKAGDGLSVKASAQRSLSDDLTFGSFGQAKEQSHSGERLKRQITDYIKKQHCGKLASKMFVFNEHLHPNLI